ncbi:MAG: hypothetical protein ABL971_14710 [Vicinamibacterales bacterium]
MRQLEDAAHAQVEVPLEFRIRSNPKFSGSQQDPAGTGEIVGCCSGFGADQQKSREQWIVTELPGRGLLGIERPKEFVVASLSVQQLALSQPCPADRVRR